MKKLIIPQPFFKNVEIYSPDDILLGTIFMETQFYDIRCQIKENNLGNGYYFLVDNKKILIDEYGRIERGSSKYVPFKYDDYLNRLLT